MGLLNFLIDFLNHWKQIVFQYSIIQTFLSDTIVGQFPGRAVVVWFVPRQFPYGLYANHMTSRAVPSAAGVVELSLPGKPRIFGRLNSFK